MMYVNYISIKLFTHTQNGTISTCLRIALIYATRTYYVLRIHTTNFLKIFPTKLMNLYENLWTAHSLGFSKIKFSFLGLGFFVLCKRIAWGHIP